MDEKSIRTLIVETGRELLENGLVARTWGNVSARCDGERMLITPSGMDYNRITEKDIVLMDILSGEWQGEHKPSGERGVHAAAYNAFPEVGFVIHTHQTAASVLSLAGSENLGLTPEERESLGNIALAGYGLPGTKKLRASVEAALASGAKTVLMAKHGALICAETKDEAMEKAALLEKICRRSLKIPAFEKACAAETGVLEDIRNVLPDTEAAVSDALLYCADNKISVPVQLDDMAQMMGGRIRIASTAETAVRQLKRRNAVLVPGLGAVVRAADADDREALKLLADKAAVCALHVRGCGEKSAVGFFGTLLMHTVYKLKYSKQKG